MCGTRIKGKSEFVAPRAYLQYPTYMRESRTNPTEADLDALEALEADASELGHIEDLLDQFNVFDTIGFERDE